MMNSKLVLFLTLLGAWVVVCAGIYLQPSAEDKACWTMEQFFVTCNKESHEEGQLKWYDPIDHEIPEDVTARVHVEQADSGLRLVVLESRKKDAGVYKCKLLSEDGVPKETAEFTLHVYKSISFQGNKDHAIAVQGDPSFSISCHVKFDPVGTHSQVTWLYNNVPINFDEDSDITESVQRPAPDLRSVLTFRDLKREREGVYTCRAFSVNNHLSKMVEYPITLRVQFKPEFPSNTPKVVWISDKQASENKHVSVNITCIVDADPVAKLQWLSNDGIPINNGRFRSQVVGVNDTENMSILTVKYMHESANHLSHERSNQLTQFECRANNDLGTSSSQYDIKVGTAPIPPRVLSHSYEEGILKLELEEPDIEPSIDIYRVDIDNRLFADFNASMEFPSPNKTYEIEIALPRGEHKLTIFSHNPIGWSAPFHDDKLMLAVVSASQSLEKHWLFTIVILVFQYALIRM